MVEFHTEISVSNSVVNSELKHFFWYTSEVPWLWHHTCTSAFCW